VKKPNSERSEDGKLQFYCRIGIRNLLLDVVLEGWTAEIILKNIVGSFFCEKLHHSSYIDVRGKYTKPQEGGTLYSGCLILDEESKEYRARGREMVIVLQYSNKSLA